MSALSMRDLDAAARQLVQSIPDRLAAPIAATSDPNEVRRLIRDEIRNVLALLSTVHDDVADVAESRLH